MKIHPVSSCWSFLVCREGKVKKQLTEQMPHSFDESSESQGAVIEATEDITPVCTVCLQDVEETGDGCYT